MKTATSLLILLLPPLATAADAYLVAPNELESREGNSVDWPFTFQDFGITSRRYQQVYDASEFELIRPAGGYIKEVWFRADMYINFGNASDFLDSVQVSLGVTARSPDSLSSVFSENIGPVYATVYGSSPLSVSTAIGWTLIPLAQPFLYVPADGNLLIDIRTTDNSPYPSPRRTLDAQETIGDSISAVYANDINAASGLVTTSGLVTQFQIEPIPEPSTCALLGLGLFGIWRFSVRRNKS